MLLSFEDLILEAIEKETDIEAMVGVCETMGDAVMYAHGDELGFGLLEGVVLDEDVFCAEAEEVFCIEEETLELFVEKAETDPEQIEVNSQKKAVGKFKVRNFANIARIMMSNANKAKGLAKTRNPLMKMVDSAKNERELKFLYDDATVATNMLSTQIQVSPALKPELEAHLEWLRKTYKPAIKSKMQELQRFNMVEDTSITEATVQSPSAIDGCTCGKSDCKMCGAGKGGASNCKSEDKVCKAEKGVTVQSPSAIDAQKEACGPTSIPHEVPSHKPNTNKSNTYETDSDADNTEEDAQDNLDLVISNENGLRDCPCDGDQANKDVIKKDKAKAEDSKTSLSDVQDGDAKLKDCIKESHYDMDEVVEQFNAFNEEIKETVKSAKVSISEGVFTFIAYADEAATKVIKECTIYDIFDESFDSENIEGTALPIGEKVEQMFNISEMAETLNTITLSFSEEVQVVIEACKKAVKEDDNEEEKKEDKECEDNKDCKKDEDDDEEDDKKDDDEEDNDKKDDEESDDDDKKDDKKDKDEKSDDDDEEESEDDDKKDDKKDKDKKDEEEPVDEAAEEGSPADLSKEDHTHGQQQTLDTKSFSDEAQRKNTNKSEAELNACEKGVTLASDNDVEHIKESVASDSSVDALPGQTPAKLPSGTDPQAKETEANPSDPECKVAENGEGVTVKATSDIEAGCRACKESTTGLYESAFASLFRSPKK